MKQSMILLHGLFGGLSNWTKVVQHFDNRFDIRIPVFPIYEKHTGNTLEFLVDFLASTIASAKLENVILIGNSLGGHIALRYALKYPQNVFKLVLTGSSGLYENNQIGSFLKRGNYAYIRERVADTFYDPAIVTDALVTEVMQVTTNSYKGLCVIRTAKATKRDNLFTRLPEIEVPTLLIWGIDDRVTPPDVAYQLYNNLPNARLMMLPECGHVPMMEKPEQFNHALEEFLL